MFDVALTLAQRHSVSIAVPAHYTGESSIVSRYEEFLDRSLDQIVFIPSPLGSETSGFKKLWWTKQFDVMYYLTDGSLFFSLAKRNILHIQFPLRVDHSSRISRLKLKNWQVKNTNSQFTKSVVESSWPVTINLVHYPLVDVVEISSAVKKIKKEKIILTVGRFFRQLHSKRQDVLVDLFRQLIKQYPQQMKGWKLVMIGGVEDADYLTNIKRKKRSLPVEFYHDLRRSELLKWYGRASIYWHAAGFGVNPAKQPEKVEHLGISTAEAMAAGCVPIVHGKGGQLEVLGSELSHLLWQTMEECIQTTAQLISNPSACDKIQHLAQDRVRIFGRTGFEQKLFSMIES